jgi:hypothetical protein
MGCDSFLDMRAQQQTLFTDFEEFRRSRAENRPGKPDTSRLAAEGTPASEEEQ